MDCPICYEDISSDELGEKDANGRVNGDYEDPIELVIGVLGYKIVR